MDTLISGSVPALVTPFEDGSWSLPQLTGLVEWHVESGTSGLVVCGTTGESPTLDEDEHVAIVAAAVRAAAGRIRIVAGAGSNATAKAVKLTRRVEEVGADATLHVAGYYNRPSNEQLAAHYTTVADSAERPVLVYDIPTRTGVRLETAVLARLAGHPMIRGIKDSTGELGRLNELRAAVEGPFAFLSGDDFSALGYLAHGGTGWVSVTGNVAPRACAALYAAVAAGELGEARRINDALFPLHRALTVVPNPAGAKYALSRAGRCGDELRAPLTAAPAEARKLIDEALDGLDKEGLL